MSYNSLTAAQIAAALSSVLPVVVTLANAVTTVSNATAVTLPTGSKSFSFALTGTGAISCTVAIEVSNDNVNWLSHEDYTVQLAGTTSAIDGFMDADTWGYHRASITAISAATDATIQARRRDPRNDSC